MSHSEQRRVGEVVSRLVLETIQGSTIEIPGRGFTHLQFRRFAGCPVCNLHLQTFARRHEQLRQAGVTTVAFFHSTKAQMLPFQGQLPFACVADPDRRWYREFGVERSAFAVLHPRVVGAAVMGLFGAPSNPFVGGSDQTGLPADFLIDRSGTVVAVHYGAHANDQWSVDALLALARGER